MLRSLTVDDTGMVDRLVKGDTDGRTSLNYTRLGSRGRGKTTFVTAEVGRFYISNRRVVVSVLADVLVGGGDGGAFNKRRPSV